MPDYGLRGKRALVTGGASGIGRGIVEALAEHGADVVLTYLSSADGATEIVAFAQKHGVKAYAMQADLTDEAAVNHVVAETQQLLGGIDILVTNTGGILGRKPTLEITRMMNGSSIRPTSSPFTSKTAYPALPVRRS
jgi:3-oxoacyl-[acyl-carrier protein] reductase